MFGVMAGGLFSGPAIERFGLRQTLLAAALVFAFAGSTGAVLDQPWLFLTGRLLTGVAIGLMTTACNSLIAIFYRGAKRTSMNGMIVGAGALGGISFVLIAGFVANWWWRGPFLLHAVVALAFVPAVILAGQVPATAVSTDTVFGNLRRLQPMVPVCIVGFAWFVIMLMSSVQSPFVMASAGVADHGVIAMVYALNAASVSISSLIAGRVAPRFHSATVLRVSFLAFAVGLCVVGAGSSPSQFAAGFVIKGFAIGFGLTAIWTWGMRSAPHDILPRALGAMTTCLYLGGAFSALATAPYQAIFGLRGQFFGVGATIALGVVLSLFAGRARLAPDAI